MSYTVMSDEILKEFDSKIYFAVTKIRNDRKRAEINTIHKEVTKIPIFNDITKDRLQDRIDILVKNGTLLNKPNRDKASLRINRDKINDPSINISTLSTHSPPAASPTTSRLSIQTQTQGRQNPLSQATPQFNSISPTHKKLPYSLLESPPSNISIDTPATRDRVARYCNNSNDIFQSEVIFETLKLTKLKNDLLDDLRVEIKDIIKKELECISTFSTTNYINEIESLKKELDMKERMITQLLNTVKEISTVNITQSAKPRPVFTCENETKANNITDMKTNQSERERSINVTPNDNIVANSQALKISLSEQLKNVKRQKKEEFYQFKSKQPIDNNMKESNSKLKHQGLYPNGTTVIVGDSIINGVIEERINKKDRPVKVRNFPGATVADMEHYLIPIIQKKPNNIILHVGTNDAKNLPSRTVLDNLLKLKALVKDSLPTCKVFISTPTLRTDDGKAQITVSQLTKHLLQLKIDTVNNNNINIRHLGSKGLHLNQSGSKRLSKNFLNAIEKF